MSPENGSLARITFDARGLVLKEGTLTPEQYTQLNGVTGIYLKDHRLISSYQNVTQVMPVIRACVIDGLMVARGRSSIEASDNLALAFKRGYQERKTLIGAMRQEVDGLTGDYRLEGELALNQNHIRGTIAELNQVVTLPRITAGSALVVEAGKRRPAYQKLLQYCRNEVERLIPGSKEQKLTKQQAAGLVRNLIFGWVVYKEPRILLETQGFMMEKGNYLTEISANPTHSLQELARLTGIDWEDNKTYLQDLAEQIKDVISTIPSESGQTQEAVLASVERAYKALSRLFLVVNPFYRLQGILSADPNDTGRSIWDRNRSITLDINGTPYRFPTPETLRVLAYADSGDSSQQSTAFRVAAVVITQLQAEIVKQKNDTYLGQLDNQFAKSSEEYEAVVAQLRSGEVPTEARLSRDMILELAQNQADMIVDELQAFDVCRKFRDEKLREALTLLSKYQDGQALDHADLVTLTSLNYAPSLVAYRMSHFLRERVKGRLRTLASLQASQTTVGSIRAYREHGYYEDFIKDALRTTAVDIVALRSKIWTNDYLNRERQLPGLELQLLWHNIITDEIHQINYAMRARLNTIFALKKDEEPEELKQAMEERRQRILKDPSDPLSRKWAMVKAWQATLERGETPQLPEVYSWEERLVNKAMSVWNRTFRLSSAFETYKRPAKIIKNEGTRAETIAGLCSKPYGSAKFLVEVIGKLAPAQLWPVYVPTLQEIVKNDLPEDFSPIIKLKALGSREEREGRKERYKEIMKGYLQGQGFGWSDERLRMLLPSDVVWATASSASFAAMFFGIETEAKDWLYDLSARLSSQVEQSQCVLSKPPYMFLRSRRTGLEDTERSIAGHRRVLRKKVETLFNQLKSLNLVLPESQFE